MLTKKEQDTIREADLFKYLSKPVDLVDLDETGPYFTERILEGGKYL